MWVITMDQRSSRTTPDRVPSLLATITTWFGSVGTPLLDPERTVGDEVQALTDDPAHAVSIALLAVRAGGWSVGIGAGEVSTPLPTSIRAAGGSAFILARAAVEAAKQRGSSVDLAVRGLDPTAAAEAEGVLGLLGTVVARRSDAAWQAIDLATSGATQDEIASRLGISQQAVSQRLRTAVHQQEPAVRAACARLLAIAAVHPT